MLRLHMLSTRREEHCKKESCLATPHGPDSIVTGGGNCHLERSGVSLAYERMAGICGNEGHGP